MRFKNTSHKDYIEVDNLIDFLTDYKETHIHYEDFLPLLFYKLEYSFGFRYIEEDKGYYKPEPTDIMLFYAIQYHTLEDGSRFMYSKNWWSDLASWYKALHNNKYVIPKKIKFSTLEKRIKQYKKLN
tara:strand:+ start:82 stop:462 length:381 start_codon:yes stop_codon:yes gene_type:complete